MSKTVVGLFSTYAKAQQVKQTLVSQGYEAQHITVVANDDEEMSGSSSSSSLSNAQGSTATGSTGSLSSGAAGIGEKVGSFFRNLTGGDDTAHQHYASGVNSGGALLAVTVNDPQAEQVASLLTQHGASEIEGEYATNSGTAMPASSSSQFANTGAAATMATGETSIPIVEEELVVGKRQVERGGVRIYSHVTERPVDASVTLHEERIEVERRPVNRAATAADFAAGSGAAIEMRATGEEAVVGKTSRVVEEVLVGKQSSERTEQVHDSVRKTEVEVEQIDATTTAGATTATTGTAMPTKSGY